MSLREALEKIRKNVEDLAGDIRASKESLFGIFEASRPTPIRNMVKKRIRSLRFFKKRTTEESV